VSEKIKRDPEIAKTDDDRDGGLPRLPLS
jgi:hypothetical protein